MDRPFVKYTTTLHWTGMWQNRRTPNVHWLFKQLFAAYSVPLWHGLNALNNCERVTHLTHWPLENLKLEVYVIFKVILVVSTHWMWGSVMANNRPTPRATSLELNVSYLVVYVTEQKLVEVVWTAVITKVCIGHKDVPRVSHAKLHLHGNIHTTCLHIVFI